MLFYTVNRNLRLVAEANIAGAKWVGKGYRLSSDGKAWISADGSRRYRPPVYKV